MRKLFLAALLLAAAPALAAPPSWTTDSRPSFPPDGLSGFNRTTGYTETWNAATQAWNPSGSFSFAGATAAVTSVTTNAATGAAGYILPVNDPTGIVVGQIASGTNIPASDAVAYVSGGTATVTLTVPQGVPSGSSYIPVSNSTSVVNSMWVTDTTTSNALSNNTLVGGVSGGAGSAPAAIVGSTTASGLQVIQVTASGTNCAVGMLLFDTTTAAVPKDSIVMASTATTVTISNALTSGVVASDNIQCYPALLLNNNTANAVLTSDSITLSPIIGLQTPTTGSVPSGTVVSLSGLSTTVGANAAVGGTLSFGPGGLLQSSTTILRATGNAKNNFTDGFGTVTLVGIGAGANVPAEDYLTTAVGFKALNASINPNSESTAIGWKSQNAITVGGYNTTLGVNTMGTCKTCTHDIAIGTDSMRNTTTEQNSIGLGINTLINAASPGYNIAIGQDAIGNGGGALSGQYNIAIGAFTLNSASISTANKNIAIGQSAGGTLTTGANNFFGGYLAGNKVTTGQSNTAIGFQAYSNATNTASFNACYGSQSCFNTTGSNNTQVGGNDNSHLSTITSGTANIVLGYNATVPSATGGSQISIGNTYYSNTATPTIGSGFGTSPSVTANAGNKIIRINVGTGGAASSGVVTMAAQTNGYACYAVNTTNPATSVMSVAPTSTTSITVTNYGRTTGTLTAWAASDVILLNCDGY